ncbi:hypothetical protein FOCC_FOCC017048 [Frankliniella occidentalis]|nr:hypothetical protein FOCC_FOCC017048 [Frankliniella occidentalis]
MSDEEEHNLNNGAGGSQSQTVRIKMPRMVQSHLAPPAEFSFRSEDWQKWVKRWKRYAVGSGLAYQDDESKLNTLLYCMGPKADDILLSLPLEDGDDEDYDRVLEEFNNHFGVCVNVVLERQKFLRRKQLPNESVDNFITDLHRLAENCKYQTMKEEFIRDNILVGMRDRTLADAMTLDKTLTLKKTSDKARAKEELQREQELAARSQADKSEVSFVKAGGGGRNNNNRRSNNNTPRGSSDKKTPTSEPACSKCGRTPQHRFADCPAKQSDCKKYNKKGHWAAMCPLEVKALNQEATGGNSDDDLFVGSIALLNQEDSFADEPPKACVSTPPSEQHDSLLSPPVRRQVNGRDTGRGPRLGPWLDDLRALDEVGDLVSGSVARVHAVGAITKSRPPWTATVTAGGRQLQFQVDTGADVTVISNKTFLEEFSGASLQKTSHRLRGPGQRPLTVLGLISVDVKWRDRTSTTDVYVIQEDARSLLGRPAIEDLKMLKWDLDAELRLRMRLMRFSYEIEHVAGKSLMSPDTLSRAPLPTQTPDRDVLTDNEVEFYARAVIADLPVSDVVMAAVREAQTNDPMAQTVLQCVREGWPQPRDVPAILAPFFKHRGSLCVVDGLLVYESRVYVPRALQEDMLARLHKGHLGETKCLGRARASVWWPGISTRVRQTCADCEICAKHRPQPVEPLMPSTVPERPWQRLAADLCQRGAHHYLVVVDYYSRYPEVARLSSLTAAAVINKMRDILARHGVPEELRTDNGPQFDCTEFRDFADEMGFRLVTMNPHHSQSNGQAEAAVKAVKNIIKKEDDPFQGLLAYRTAPTESGYSPAELLMGRRLRTTVPTLGTNLQPRVVDVQHHRSVLEEGKKTAKAHFDRRHRARELRPLVSGERVWVRDTKANGVVVRRRPEPRSYDVQVEGHGVLRRNRAFLTPLQCATDEADESDPDDAERPPEVERVVDNDVDEALQAPPPRRSARTARKPERLIEVCLVRNAKDY